MPRRMMMMAVRPAAPASMDVRKGARVAGQHGVLWERGRVLSPPFAQLCDDDTGRGRSRAVAMRTVTELPDKGCTERR
jgi:hypothetical protein